MWFRNGGLFRKSEFKINDVWRSLKQILKSCGVLNQVWDRRGCVDEVDGSRMDLRNDSWESRGWAFCVREQYGVVRV